MMKSKQTLCALAIGLALQSSYTAAADSVVLEKNYGYFAKA